MKDLVPALRDTIFAPSYEILTEYAEIGIDALLDSDILKDIPIVGTLTKICQIGYNIHDRNLIKQTLGFITGFNTGTLPQERIDEYRNELEENPAKAEKELGRVLIILGNHVEDMQSQILGSFYKAYVNGAISWDKFCELSEANRRMFVSDYPILIAASYHGGIDINNRELYQVDRLISLGLLQNQNRLGGSMIVEFNKKQEKSFDMIITTFGKTFCQHLPKIFNI